MRQIPPALAAQLASGVTTLARCWTLTRRDGAVLGFTDHDRDLVLDGVVHRAATAGSEVTTALGLAADAHELAGALADDALAEADLAAGRWDGATVALFLVDWSAPATRVLVRTGTLGEVARAGAAFVAELRGLSDRLDAPHGRLFSAGCDADLGDGRCRVDLDAHRRAGTVVAVEGPARLRVAGLDGLPDDWASGGVLAFTSGADAGLSVEIKAHRVEAAGVVLVPWQQPPEPVAPGDAFTVTAGCDKRFATCREKFANAANFRGFPHMPGNDFVLRYPVSGEAGHDGGRLTE